jgi:hypothetical protein
MIQNEKNLDERRYLSTAELKFYNR